MLDCGISAGLEYLGVKHRTLCFCEREAYAISQLIALMEAECLDSAPIWSDVTTFPGKQFRGMVDLIHGGFPCQPHSVAGAKKGMQDERWLWDDIARIIRDVDPWVVYLENVPGLIATGGLAACLASLSEMGFDAEWGCLSAAAVGASHKRERIFILAIDPKRGRGILRQSSGGGGFADRGDEELADTEHAGQHGAKDRESAAQGNDGYATGEIAAGEPAGLCDADGQMANAARQRCGETRPAGERQAQRSGIAGDELAYPMRPGRQQIPGSVSQDAPGEIGAHRSGGRNGELATGECAVVANASDGLIPQPWRGSGGRDGAGSAVTVLDNPTSARHNGTRVGTDTDIGGGQCVLGEGCEDVADANTGRREQREPENGCDAVSMPGCVLVANPSSPRPQGSEHRGTRIDHRGGQEAHGPTSEFCGIFAHGPSDSRWPEIIGAAPWLAPALGIERKRLNPRFVEFLMGLPIGYTEDGCETQTSGNDQQGRNTQARAARGVAQWKELCQVRLNEIIEATSPRLQQADGCGNTVREVSHSGAHRERRNIEHSTKAVCDLRNDCADSPPEQNKDLLETGMSERIREDQCEQAMENRANRLRALGNGVVPLCAAAAFIVLARRAGLI